jgi:hypothetical protein
MRAVEAGVLRQDETAAAQEKPALGKSQCAAVVAVQRHGSSSAIGAGKATSDRWMLLNALWRMPNRPGQHTADCKSIVQSIAAWEQQDLLNTQNFSSAGGTLSFIKAYRCS